jgi:chromosome segregation ATPase
MKYNKLKAEYKLQIDKNAHLEDSLVKSMERVKSLEEELAQNEREHSNTNKKYNNQMMKFAEEIRKIKESWIPMEKFQEHVQVNEELQKQIKSLKDDINRKKDLITTLRGQAAENEKLMKENANLTSSQVNSQQSDEKIKSLNKELTKKESLIKELRSAIEQLKANEKKLNEELSQLMEKTKISKIDLQRKETLLKEYKEKLKENTNNLSNNVNNDESLREELKKKKLEVDRKDAIMKTLKAKVESQTLEIEQLRNLNMKISKTGTNEMEREIRQHENTRNKLEELTNTNENLMSIVRRIFKDLIMTYEKLKIRNKLNLNNTSYNKMKEGLEILGVGNDDLDEYLNPNISNKKLDMFERINNLLETPNVEAENFIQICNTLKEGINNFTELKDNFNKETSFQQINTTILNSNNNYF